MTYVLLVCPTDKMWVEYSKTHGLVLGAVTFWFRLVNILCIKFWFCTRLHSLIRQTVKLICEFNIITNKKECEKKVFIGSTSLCGIP